MISSIRLHGTTACMHLSGAADTEAFVTYVQQVLCPTLRPGDIVVMDNLSLHKSPEVTRLVQAAGAEVRFLPAYSPDLNPIEKMWSKIKSLLRPAIPKNLMRPSVTPSPKSPPRTPQVISLLVVIVLFKML